MTERRLTAEMRETRKDELKGTKFAFGYLTREEKFSRDALHDLDVLEGELVAAQAQVAALREAVCKMQICHATGNEDLLLRSLNKLIDVAHDTDTATATYTAEVRAQARREALEEAAENLKYATNEDEIAGVMQRMAAQPEEATKSG